jgi:arylsulfatase A-like enzyme
VLIITDHHAYFGHHREGELDLTMDRFESLAKEGARFERGYSVCPICSPARASMMTGIYPSSHGMKWNTDGGNRQNLRDLRSGQPLYSFFLSQAGYRNAYIGKWHCGHEKLPVDFGIEGWSLPDYGKPYMSQAYREYAEKRGFDDARAVIEHNVNHPEWEGQTLTLHHPSPWRFMNSSGVMPAPPDAHEEFFVANLAVEKLSELATSGQPFSLVVSFWGPHQPYFPTEPYASIYTPEDIPEYPTFKDDYRGKPIRHYLHRDSHHGDAQRWKDWRIWQKILSRCYGQIMQTDAAIGRVLDSLNELGLTENTLVLCCSDHGDAVASHGGLWDKASTFTEEVSRVPLAIRWPAGLPGGGKVTKPVSNMDVTATMLNAAGVAVPDWMHSKSLLPLARDPQIKGWPDEVICEHHGHGENMLMRIVVWDRYKYVAALFDGNELYDLDKDPHEMTNLAGDPAYSEIEAESRQRIIRHMESTGDRVGSNLLQILRLGL